MDFCRSAAFGHRGDLFLAQFGTYAPLNTTRGEALNRGFQVARVDVKSGSVTPFLRNVKPGPASYHPGTGGLERPVDCKFSPDGKSLYVLDFGVNNAMRETVTVFGHTGVLWRVTRKGGGLMSGDPIFVEIDDASWRGHMDEVEAWLGKVLTSQAAFRRLLDEVHPRLHEPHVRKFVVGEIGRDGEAPRVGGRAVLQADRPRPLRRPQEGGGRADQGPPGRL